METAFSTYSIKDLKQPESNHSVLLPHEAYDDVIKLMAEYGLGNVFLTNLIDELSAICAASNLEFNLNSDTQRLLVCRYPDKLTVSTNKDVFALAKLARIQSNDSEILPDIITEEGKMTKGGQYEEERLNKLREEVHTSVGNKKIIGAYGQLSFDSADSSDLVQETFEYIFDQLDPMEYAICHSGSLLGVSGIAYRAARRKNFQSIGIIPDSIGHLIDKQNFDHLIIEGEDWGDASFVFGGLPNIVTFFGGGYWSYLEYQKALQNNKPIHLMQFEGARFCSAFSRDLTYNPINQQDLNQIFK